MFLLDKRDSWIEILVIIVGNDDIIYTSCLINFVKFNCSIFCLSYIWVSTFFSIGPKSWPEFRGDFDVLALGFCFEHIFPKIMPFYSRPAEDDDDDDLDLTQNADEFGIWIKILQKYKFMAYWKRQKTFEKL